MSSTGITMIGILAVDGWASARITWAGALLRS